MVDKLESLTITEAEELLEETFNFNSSSSINKQK